MFIADFHIHSKYSRATSRDCLPEQLNLWAARKGLNLVGSGDFTHPAWRQELQTKLEPAEQGLYKLKKEFVVKDATPPLAPTPRFIISGEISSIYKQGGKVRKVHNLILLPTLQAAEALSCRLETIGNLHSDGRPILGLSSRDLLEITLESCEQAVFIPAHIWTPHFSLFGAYSGFDDIRECFGDLAGHIYALETGLSSDPAMNWRLSALDNYTLVSNSDAHSPSKLAREANIFDTELSYAHITQAMQKRESGEFCGTIEFFPEEGKYHYDGHRNCKVCLKPTDTKAGAGLCPVCGGPVTVGVLSRVEDLADRAEGYRPVAAKSYESLTPLDKVIASSAGYSAVSQKGRKIYGDLLRQIGPELFVLRQAPLDEIARLAGPLVAEGLRRLRAKEVELIPGYDGVYGAVKLIDETERQRILGQTHLFGGFWGAIDNPPNKTKESAAAANTAGNRVIKQPKGNQEQKLNAEQWEAVRSTNQVIAVIAGPGAGKTRTLVARIAYLLREGGIEPGHITAVTFTNKAAVQMRQRLERELQDKRAVKSMNIGTFHSICLRELTKKPASMDITLINEADALTLMADILAERALSLTPREILRRISLLKNGALTDIQADIPAGVYEDYQRKLKEFGAMDYDDILLEALALANNRQQGRANRRFSHLLVDEFQDINRLQYRLLQAWGVNSSALFVIGDPQQSIYGFRGSAADCFFWLFNDYPQTGLVQLTKNYRSTPRIIACAAAAIAGEKDAAPAQTAAGRESGVKVRLMQAGYAALEAQTVAKEIGYMVGGLDMLESGANSRVAPPRGFNDIAVLYRTNRQAALFERYFKMDGIPYTVTGREDYLQDAQVVNTLAFFHLLLNSADTLSRRRCLQNLDQQRFTELYAKYQPLIRRSKPGRLLQEWIADNELKESAPLIKLAQSALLYENTPAFLHNLTLGREADVFRNSTYKRERQAVQLMTLHAAKGLEFPVVFLAGLTEGLLPLAGQNGTGQLEEERRLLYVGMTRAQEELILLTYGKPSLFLDKLPQEDIDIKDLSKRKTFEQESLF